MAAAAAKPHYLQLVKLYLHVLFLLCQLFTVALLLSYLYVLLYSMTKATTHDFNFKYRSQMTESNLSLQNFTKQIYSSIGLKFIFGVLVLQLIISIFCYFKSTLYYISEPHI